MQDTNKHTYNKKVKYVQKVKSYNILVTMLLSFATTHHLNMTSIHIRQKFPHLLHSGMKRFNENLPVKVRSLNPC